MVGLKERRERSKASATLKQGKTTAKEPSTDHSRKDWGEEKTSPCSKLLGRDTKGERMQKKIGGERLYTRNGPPRLEKKLWLKK